MKKMIRIILIFLIIYIIFFVNKVYASVEVSSWKELKVVIEQKDNSEIILKKSNDWEALEKIKINKGQNITLIANDEIEIKRGKSLENTAVIENDGNLKLSGKITLDGNFEVIKSKKPLIINNNASIQIENGVILQNNVSNENGGALYGIKSEIYINNTKIYNNSSEMYGGGIYVEDSILKLNNVEILDNMAKYGGGVYVQGESSNTELNNVNIRRNEAKSGSGGGVYAYGELKITGNDSIFGENIAYTYGGGIMIKNKCSIENAIVQNNKAITESGGGIRVDGILKLDSGVISNNYAQKNGGGIDWNIGVLCANTENIKNNQANQKEDNINPEYCDESLDWSKDKDLKLEKINVELLKKYERGTDVGDYTLQGMTVAGNYIIFAQIENETGNTYINIVDKKSMKILKVIDKYCFAHANALTYNSKDKICYISYYLGKDGYIDSFRIDDNYELEIIEHVKTNRYYFGLAYNDDTNGFIGISGEKIYFLDEKFNETKNFTAKTTLTKQDIAYSKGHIYYACYEVGNISKYQSIANNREKYSNIVYVYDLDGNLERTLHIPNYELCGEIEDVYVEEDGNIIFAYNTDTWKSISFYKRKSGNTLNNDNEKSDEKDNEKGEEKNDEKDNGKVDEKNDINKDEKNDIQENKSIEENDNTVSTNILPNTGWMRRCGIAILIMAWIIMFISFVKLKKYLE